MPIGIEYCSQPLEWLGKRQNRQSLPLGRQWEMVVHGIPKGMLIIDANVNPSHKDGWLQYPMPKGIHPVLITDFLGISERGTSETKIIIPPDILE